MGVGLLRWCGVLAIFLMSSEASAAPTSCAAPPPAVVVKLPPGIRVKLSAASAAIAARPMDAAATGRLGMLLHALEQFEAAAGCYAHARQLAPNTFAWAYMSGVAHAELGAYDAAIAAFRRARDIDDRYLPARLRLADALLATHELDGSESEYRSLLRGYPELALAHYGMARVLRAKGDADGALRENQTAVDLAPEFGAALYALSLAYRDAGQPVFADRYMSAFRRFGTRKPSLPDPVMEDMRSMGGTARELIARAVALGRAGRLDDAIALHLEALAADPDAAQAHVNLISLYARAGQPERAEQHYRDALRLGSDLADAHYNFGVLMASRGRDVDAVAAFTRALEVDPFHARAHNNIAALLAREGKGAEALKHYRQALASDPQYATARFGLGRVLVDLGRPADAVEQFQKLIQLPESADTARNMFALASALYASGNPEKGLEYAEQAARVARQRGQLELFRTIERELVQMHARRR
jgi:tetratricopeptide (TPR) repeat protein